MKFVLIFGPQAVGKMTVGHELEKKTELKLLHNHMTIDLLQPIFDFSPEMWRLSSLIREEIFKSVANSELPGIIFTYVWAFDLLEDGDFVEKICSIFESAGGQVYLVELEANEKERLIRNRTPHRLEHKPTKRNIEQSEQNLVETMKLHRLNSVAGEITRPNYIKINNSNLGAEEVAVLIKEKFDL